MSGSSCSRSSTSSPSASQPSGAGRRRDHDGPAMSIAIDLTGKTALITGASQGIGAEIARTLHRAGARVILNHPGIGTAGADAAALATELPGAIVRAADVADPAAVKAMMEDVRRV